MLRSVVLPLLIAFCLAANADEPQHDATKPPYERLLQGDDAKRAAKLNEKIEGTEVADKYDDAIELSKELLRSFTAWG
jgi:hypothetical protein